MNVTESLWPAPTVSSPLKAEVTLPSSKSLNARYLALAQLAHGTSYIHNALEAQDAQHMEDALRALGSKLQVSNGTISFEPEFSAGEVTVDCGMAGTVLRFAPLLAMFRKGDTRFTGDKKAERRPMTKTLESIEKLGVKVTRENGDAVPFTVHGTGTVKGRRIEIDSSDSSQFITALLLISFNCEQGLEIVHTGNKLPSAAHINMTYETLRNLGIEVESSTPSQWKVPPQSLKPFEVTVEPDLSNAAPFACAAMATGGEIAIPHWPLESTQAGHHLPGILEKFGGTTKLLPNADGITGTMIFIGPSKLQNPEMLDLSAVGELAPNIAALCLLAQENTQGKNRTEISGISHLRGHETDRLKALTAEFTKLGGKVTETTDGLVFSPSSELHGTEFQTYHDHRMATTAAVLGLRIPEIKIVNVKTVAKTMPEFTKMWESMVNHG